MHRDQHGVVGIARRGKFNRSAARSGYFVSSWSIKPEQRCKPADDWRIGTEHEKFAYRLSDLRPLPYDGPDGIGALLEGLVRSTGSGSRRPAT